MKIISYEEKEMIPLTKEEKKSYKNQEKCHICEEKFSMDKDDKDYINRKKVKDHCHYTGTSRGAAHSKCNLNFKVPKDILIRFIHSFRFMSTSLSEFVDNMSGIFNSIECKSCIEKIKINSERCFFGLKNKRLICKCKKCKEERKRPINKNFRVYINFVMVILKNSFCY